MILMGHLFNIFIYLCKTFVKNKQLLILNDGSIIYTILSFISGLNYVFIKKSLNNILEGFPATCVKPQSDV